MTPTGTRSVDYRGVHLSVPSDWAVVDLDADPTRCVRLDVRAVYLGRPGSQQDCPAHLVGRAETIWLHPGSDRASTATTSRTTALGTLRAHAYYWCRRHHGGEVHGTGRAGRRHLGLEPVGGSTTSSPPRPRARRPRAPARPPARRQPPRPPRPRRPPPPRPPPPRARPRRPRRRGHTPSPGWRSTRAPPRASRRCSSWGPASPYRAVGIYIGGSMRACGDGNLSSTWVSQVSSMGGDSCRSTSGHRHPASTRPASAPSTRRRRLRRARPPLPTRPGARPSSVWRRRRRRLLRHGGVRPHRVRLHGHGPVVPDGMDAGAARPRLHLRRVRQHRLAHGRPVHGDGHDGLHRTRQRVVRQLERAADPVRLDESPRVPGQLLGRRPAAPPVRHRQRDVGRGEDRHRRQLGRRPRHGRAGPDQLRRRDDGPGSRRSSSPGTCPTGSPTRGRACRDAPTRRTPTAARRRTAPRGPRPSRQASTR